MNWLLCSLGLRASGVTSGDRWMPLCGSCCVRSPWRLCPIYFPKRPTQCQDRERLPQGSLGAWLPVSVVTGETMPLGVTHRPTSEHASSAPRSRVSRSPEGVPLGWVCGVTARSCCPHAVALHVHVCVCARVRARARVCAHVCACVCACASAYTAFPAPPPVKRI